MTKEPPQLRMRKSVSPRARVRFRLGVPAMSSSRLSVLVALVLVVASCREARAPERASPLAAAGTCTPTASPAPSTPAPPPPATLFAAPESLAPRRFLVLGPLPSPLDPARKGRPGLDRDYLSALGGEARARFDGSTTLVVDGQTYAVRAATVDAASTIDFRKLFGSDTDAKTAYAYAEWAVERPVPVAVRFGSDDAAAVWLNGRLAHRVERDRGLDPDGDRFELLLEAGVNRLMIKVDNSSGGWGFAVRFFDEAGQARLRRLDARQHLEKLGPASVTGEYRIDETFPELAWTSPADAEQVLTGGPMKVRWYGPDLEPTDRPAADGQYTAVVEAQTLDGYPFREMLAFAKVAPSAMHWFSLPPTHELPLLSVPWRFGVALNDAQIAELSRHFWLGAGTSLGHGPQAAVAALALAKLGHEPPPKGEPLWLSSGFVQVAEQEMRLRRKLEGRAPVRLAPPEVVPNAAPELRTGTEAQAGLRSGLSGKLRAVARAWAQADDQPFVVLVARRGVVVFHEGFNGMPKDGSFYPASTGKTIAALTFARAVDQGLLTFDQPVGSVLPDWSRQHTAHVTFRHCFNHVTGLTGHASHGGLFNPYLDSALLAQDAAFASPGTHFHYNGDDVDLAGLALEVLTGESIWRLLYEHMEKPFAEPVDQLDLGFGNAFTAMYLAKVGQMILQDGRYGHYVFFKPGFLATLRPRRILDSAPELDDPKAEAGIGFEWMPDPPGPREAGPLGPNVFGHGAASGTVWRIDPDHEVLVVVGRSGFKDFQTNSAWTTKLVRAVAEGIR